MWTDARIALLRKLWLEGLSAARIAELIGEVSRNAVIGKVHRLRIKRGDEEKAQTLECCWKEGERVDVRECANVTVSSDGECCGCCESGADGAVRSKKKSTPPGTTILDLGGGMCKWPLGELGDPPVYFCSCATIKGMPYCAKHAAMAYQAATSRGARNAENARRNAENARRSENARRGGDFITDARGSVAVEASLSRSPAPVRTERDYVPES